MDLLIQRILLAEYQGLISVVRPINVDFYNFDFIPNYPKDLNIVREIEMFLEFPRTGPKSRYEYIHTLQDICNKALTPEKQCPTCADAEQRCEALIKTLNLQAN